MVELRGWYCLNHKEYYAVAADLSLHIGAGLGTHFVVSATSVIGILP